MLACSIFSIAAAPAARAQWAVIDVSAIAQLMQEVQTLQQQLVTAQAQLQQAKTALQSMSGNRGMAQLLAGTTRNYLPTNAAQLGGAAQGGGAYSSLASAVLAAVGANAVLSPAQLSTFAAGDRQQIIAARQTVALRQALANAALTNSSERFAAIQSLISAISTAGDQKAILDLQARISAELAMLQNEQTKLQVLAQAGEALAAANAQQQREQAIASQGRFETRFQPTRSGAAMGFFATFWSWLNGQLAAYIGSNTARLAAVLEPAIVTCAILYVMAWGYLHLTGQIQEPFVAGLKRILMLAVILGVGLNLWLYNSLLVDTFYNAPSQLAGAVIGAGDPVGTIDAIWESGGAVAGNLWVKGDLLSGFGFLIAGAVVWCLMGLLCVYAMFLIALSDIALAVLLALGPLFIAMLFFDATKRIFSAWIAQLLNYALITILTVMVTALLLQVVQSYAAQTAARGSAILTMDALHMVLIAVLVLLILRQIMPIAAGIAGGVALSSFGFASRTIGWSLQKAAPAREFATSGSVRAIIAAPRHAGEVMRRGERRAGDKGDAAN
jgi:type IV secretion system protein VirB6